MRQARLSQEDGETPTPGVREVVRNAVGPALRLGQMAEHDHRRFGQPELRRSQHPTMARDQFAALQITP